MYDGDNGSSHQLRLVIDLQSLLVNFKDLRRREWVLVDPSKDQVVKGGRLYDN